MKTISYKYDHKQHNHHSSTVGTIVKAQWKSKTRVEGVLKDMTQTTRSPEYRATKCNTKNIKDMQAMFFNLNKK